MIASVCSGVYHMHLVRLFIIRTMSSQHHWFRAILFQNLPPRAASRSLPPFDLTRHFQPSNVTAVYDVGIVRRLCSIRKYITLLIIT